MRELQSGLLESQGVRRNLCFDCSDFRAAAVNKMCLNVASGQMLAAMQLTNAGKTDYFPSYCSPFVRLTDESRILPD